jgi:serine protease inhibitor
MKLRSAAPPPLDPMDVIVNRPFLVFVIDNYNNVTLFAGRVSDPSIS